MYQYQLDPPTHSFNNGVSTPAFSTLEDNGGEEGDWLPEMRPAVLPTTTSGPLSPPGGSRLPWHFSCQESWPSRLSLREPKLSPNIPASSKQYPSLTKTQAALLRATETFTKILPCNEISLFGNTHVDRNLEGGHIYSLKLTASKQFFIKCWLIEIWRGRSDI